MHLFTLLGLIHVPAFYHEISMGSDSTFSQKRSHKMKIQYLGLAIFGNRHIRQSSSSLSLHQLPGGFHQHLPWSLPPTLSQLLPQSPAKNGPQWRFCENICPFQLVSVHEDNSISDKILMCRHFILDTPLRHTHWGTHESLRSNSCHQTKTNTDCHWELNSTADLTFYICSYSNRCSAYISYSPIV